MSSKKEKIIVAAVDFGTTYSGYAFSFKHEYEKDPTKVSTNHAWNSGSLLSLKQPTCVLCNSKGEFDSFGYDAENKYTALAEDDKHHSWYFFRRFKMVLHEKQIKRGMEVEDDKGRKLPAIKVFGMAIHYLKTHLLNTLEKQGTGLKADDIHWILTVPAIWTDSAKQFMREAADEAGIDGRLLTIALEPEAAAMYCQLLSSDHLSSKGRFDDNKYMVIDLGGGTADITVHEKQHDGTIKEVHKASGGAWGGTKVDEEFKQMIIKIIGAPSFKTFCDENKDDNMEMLRELETKKRSIRTDKEEKITIKVPVALKDTYEKKSGETIKDAVEQTQYKGKIQWTADKIRLDAELFRSLFQNCIRKITEHLADLLEKPGVKGTSTMLMVGGFSECQLMQEAIKRAFPKPKVVIPNEAGLVVLKGAVIFGHRPQIITSRIAKYTYGINISPPFDPTKHPKDKKVSVGGNDRCKDVFKKYIEVGESVKIGEAKTGKHVTIKSNQKEMLLKIYASPEKNPMFVTDSKCEMVGRVVVKLPDTTDNIRVDVKMMFGETELMVEAEEETTKAKFAAFFDFL
ncbi:hypothetical protein CHS0354_026367 [Potamilus streckersoni]|uniref:Heat shock 70 kDa protein n=1 Tax=Potamilus streckersoni TaxID=2493646 RepID=A0AAE0T388_9BIVA|nr:hypothetical protein CHS0354_026367 [Potamilus streckersoni]